MTKYLIHGLLSALVCAGIGAASARAESIFFGSSSNSLTTQLILNGGAATIDYTDRGWYNDTGFHGSTNNNYVTGLCSDCGGPTFQSFFLFDLPTGLVVTSAILRVNTASYDSFDPTETLALFDVTTDLGALVAGGSGLTSIYDDLGSGVFFGSRVFTAADANTDVDIFLNANAIAAINNALGGSIAFGGSLTAPSVSDVPEPGTISLLGLGVFGIVLGGYRKRRKG